MAKKVNILLTCVGRRVSLLRAFRRAMSDLSVHGRIFGADLSPLAPAFYAADESFLVPGVNSPDYGDVLLHLCREHDVDLVVPLIDWELHVLAAMKDRFADTGTRLLVSSPRVTRICRDKVATVKFLQESGLGTPRNLSLDEAKKGPFPLIAKDRYGSSGRNMRQVSHPRALKRLRNAKNIVIQELVRGTEYTVDVYAGFDGTPRVAVPRQRLKVRSGEVEKARTVRHQDVIRDSIRLVEVLAECVGVITVQCRVSRKSGVKFFDLNPRFGGGVPLSIRAGADFPRWILEEHLGQTPAIDADAWEENLYMLRYDAGIFRRGDEMPSKDEAIRAPAGTDQAKS